MIEQFDTLLKAIEVQTGKKVFLVGGAVRDSLMHITPKDLDFVTVAVKEDELIAKGWEATGKAFPVFRHHQFPNIELALGRAEKKVSQGHSGFTWTYADDLRTDLERRDFTVNSLAYHPSVGIIDYFNGVDDLMCRILRHVSPAFSEDPNRVFRAARFAACKDFQVANETIDMMETVNLYEAQAEVIRSEMERAMKGPNPRAFFEVLRAADCLKEWFPELHNLIHVPAGFIKHHPEGSVFNHSILSMDYAMRTTGDIETGLLALTHDFGKGRTPKDKWPHHYGHEHHDQEADGFFDRFNYGSNTRLKARTHIRQHMKWQAHMKNKLRSQTLLEYYNNVSRFISQHFNVCRADANGKDLEPINVPVLDQLEAFFIAVKDNMKSYMTLAMMERDQRHIAKLQCVKDQRQKHNI